MFSIMTNPTAIGAQSAVTNSNNTLSKTIQQLSTGLRINSSADDASGMAVSEKLRGQISGLKVAARNAQDGISLLQTAEANMGTMTSMVQRIRELAVQAGDPAYTSSDRVMLQTEVDQLKQEINRVSSSAEFNTKKLLNGDAAALWSSSGAINIDAIVKGATVPGNYKLEINATAGKNAVYKTNTMTVADAINNITTRNSAVETRLTDARISGIQQSGMLATTSAVGSMNGLISIGIAAGDNGAAILTSAYGTIGRTNNITFGIVSGLVTGAAHSGYYEVEALTAKEAAGTGTFRARFINAVTGAIGEWQTGNVEANGTNTAITFGNGGGTIAAGTDMFGADGTFTANDKRVTARTHNYDETNNQGDVNITINTGGTGTLANSGISTVGLTLRAIAFYSTTNGISKTFTTAQWDSKSNVAIYGKLTLTTSQLDPFAAIDIPAGADTALRVGSNDIDGFTKIGSLKEFINADGRNILDNTQELTMYANGKQAIITLEKGDSVKDFMNKMRNAITETLSMRGSLLGDEINNLVKFVRPGTQSSDGASAMPGTFVFQGGIMGKNSEISFSGNQGVIDALGVKDIQSAVDATLNVTVTNAHTGAKIASDTISDGVLRNAIENVDIIIDQSKLSSGSWAQNGDLQFANVPNATSFLHLVNNATVAAIGANEGQTLDISIGRMDTVSLGIDSVNVLTIDAAQKAITQLDLSLDTINKGRAIIGAQMNRLNYTINNLNVSRENMMAAESRIRDLDIAEASSNLAAQQVRLQAATAMLAQANQLPSYAAQLLR